MKTNISTYSMNFNQIPKSKENGTDFMETKSKSTPIAMVAPEVKQTEVDTEITKTCAVLGCEDYKHLEADNLFSFPEDANQRQIWTNLTGRQNWTPTDYSYICILHFSVDSFTCNAKNDVVLTDNAVPSLKLPGHVLEVEYIDEETLESDGYDDPGTDYDYDMDTTEKEDIRNEYNGEIDDTPVENEHDTIELVKLFTEVQKMQRQAVNLKDRLKANLKLHNQQTRYLKRLKSTVEIKEKLLERKGKKKARILLSIQDKIKEDTSGLVLAMPNRHTDDLKNFALSVYKYSPQSYIYIRNTLRTLLPSTDVLESWLNAGFQPKNVMNNSNSIKVIAEQTATELACKVSLH